MTEDSWLVNVLSDACSSSRSAFMPDDQALHASIWYYKQMNRLSSILQLHCLGSREPQVQRSHAINVFFLVSATYTQLHVIKLSYFCTSYIMTNWCRPTCIHKKHSYRRETATPHFRPIFNPPLGLGVKKPPAHFLNQQKNSVQRWALSFGDFSCIWSG